MSAPASYRKAGSGGVRRGSAGSSKRKRGETQPDEVDMLREETWHPDLKGVVTHEFTLGLRTHQGGHGERGATRPPLALKVV